jgi:hypothetical protein
MKITEEEIEKVQRLWADGIVQIGKICINGGDYISVGRTFVSDLYSYDDETGCLFKPTKAITHVFRENIDDATSYFVGGCVPEDKGFALHPWKRVYFDKKRLSHIEGNIAIVMGYYYFIDYQNVEMCVEYTFGYKKKEGKNHLVIFTHHSSIPFK